MLVILWHKTLTHSRLGINMIGPPHANNEECEYHSYLAENFPFILRLYAAYFYLRLTFRLYNGVSLIRNLWSTIDEAWRMVRLPSLYYFFIAITICILCLIQIYENPRARWPVELWPNGMQGPTTLLCIHSTRCSFCC